MAPAQPEDGHIRQLHCEKRCWRAGTHGQDLIRVMAQIRVHAGLNIVTTDVPYPNTTPAEYADAVALAPAQPEGCHKKAIHIARKLWAWTSAARIAGRYIATCATQLPNTCLTSAGYNFEWSRAFSCTQLMPLSARAPRPRVGPPLQLLLKRTGTFTTERCSLPSESKGLHCIVPLRFVHSTHSLVTRNREAVSPTVSKLALCADSSMRDGYR